MGRPTFFLPLLSYLLISSVKAATRTSLLDITLEQNLTTSNVSSLNVDLPEPWGPPNFDVRIDPTVGPLAIPANETFMLALAVLNHETPRDFNGLLPEARMTYRLPLYPHVEIGIASTRRDRRVPRKYLFWTIARLLNSYIHLGGPFVSANVIMELGGFKVGTFFLVAHESGPGAFKAGRLNSGFQETVLALPFLQQSPDNGTVASFGTDDIEWHFNFYGQLLKRDDIFMATIASLIDVARHDEHTFVNFAGSCPGYGAFVWWHAPTEPRRLTKLLLIQSIVSAAYYANREGGNWHELSAVLYVDKQHVAFGGYKGSPFPPPGPPGSDSFS